MHYELHPHIYRSLHFADVHRLLFQYLRLSHVWLVLHDRRIRVIGLIALVVVLVATAVALAVAVLARTEAGRIRVIKMFEKFPLTKNAMYQLAVSRFASALSAFVASGDRTALPWSAQRRRSITMS